MSSSGCEPTGVCDSVHRASLPQCMLGYHPPREQTPPKEETPRSRHPPPGADPPGAGTPPAQSMLGDTVNARAVRILLECNLVANIDSKCLLIYIVIGLTHTVLN